MTYTLNANIIEENGEITVAVTTTGLDRTDVRAWGVPNRKLAERLVRAIRAGVAVTNPIVRTDVYGKTYLATETTIRRTMNADLKRLGF